MGGARIRPGGGVRLGAEPRLREIAAKGFADAESIAEASAPLRLAFAEPGCPPFHRVVVLSRWRRAGCTMLASHLVRGLLEQGRAVKLESASAVIQARTSSSELLEIVDGSASAAQGLELAEPALHAELATRAHTLLAVLSCKEDCAQGLLRLCAVLRDAGAPPPFVVLNRFDAGREQDRKVLAALQAFAGKALLPWIIPDDPAVALAQSRGRCVSDDAPDSQASAVLGQLCAWLGARHDGGAWLTRSGEGEFSAGR